MDIIVKKSAKSKLEKKRLLKIGKFMVNTAAESFFRDNQGFIIQLQCNLISEKQ